LLQADSCRVLVLDEDRHNADTTTDLLHLWGHEAEAAYSAEDALTKAPAFDPDVILMDLGRTLANGLNLARELQGCCPDAKLLAITNYSAGDIVRRTRHVGFNQVLQKPVPARLVKEAVENECTTPEASVAGRGR
jgi:two-component system cell cycle response regulator DivK